jgi:hypothetical protein|tara:strand:+ start:270 stop:668 length:399 start_codon:yes stop_codon:yes gene_type:complete
MDSIVRRVRNTQRSNIVFKDGTPSKSTITEGEELIALRKNRGLSLFRRQKGILWWMNFTKDGNEAVEKDLKVNGNIASGSDITSEGSIKAGTTFKSSDGSSGINDSIQIVDAIGTHTVTIKDGLITSWQEPS